MYDARFEDEAKIVDEAVFISFCASSRLVADYQKHHILETCA